MCAGPGLVLLRWAEAAQQAGGRLGETAEALDEAIGRFEALGELRHAGEALAVQSVVRWNLGEPESIRYSERAVALLEATPGPQLVRAMTSVASRQFVTGSYAAAVETADRVLALAGQLGLGVPGAALGVRGCARSYLGDLGGLGDMEHALEL